MRSGYVNLEMGRLRRVGDVGNSWSQTASPKLWDASSMPSAYILVIDANVYPTGGPNYRFLGYPLRCLLSQDFQEFKISLSYSTT